MHIAIFTPQLPPQHGGIGYTILQIVNIILQHKKDKITILIPAPCEEYKQKINEYFGNKFNSNLSIIFLQSQRMPKILERIFGDEINKMTSFLSQYRKLSIYQYLKNISPDVICVFDPLALAGIPFLIGYGKVVGKDYSTEYNVPLIAYYHSHYISAIKYYPFYLRLLLGALFKYLTKKYLLEFDQVLVFSHFICNELNELNVKNTAVMSIEGLSENLLPQIRINSKSGQKKTTIIFFGRLMREKNINMMINIFTRLCKKNPNFNVLIIGDGPEKSKMIQKLNNTIDIRFHNWIENNDLYNYLAESDIFINCTFFETLCISLAESMYYKCVPVVYYKGGHTMFIDNYVNGFLCKNEDDYIKYLNFLIKNPKYRKEMGRKAQNKIIHFFSSERNVSNFMDFMNNFKRINDFLM